jgi:hypothetical protein
VLFVFSGIGEAPTTYQVPFEEELADGELVKVRMQHVNCAEMLLCVIEDFRLSLLISSCLVLQHKWPVTPFQIRLVNNGKTPCFIEVKVDGKPAHPHSKAPFLKPGESKTLEVSEDP